MGKQVIIAAVMLTASPAMAQNFVTHQSPQAPATQQSAERPAMVFSAPAYTPNAYDQGGQPVQPVPEVSDPAPIYEPYVPGQGEPYPSQYPSSQPAAPAPAPAYTQPQPQPPAPAYVAPVPQPQPPAPRYTAPAPQPAPPAYVAPAQHEPAPTYANPRVQQTAPSIEGYTPAYQMPGPITVRSAPQSAVPVQNDIGFQPESDTSRRLIAMEDQYYATIKKLEAAKAARKAAILDQFEKDAADPAKVVGLAERLRAAMAALEEIHKAALADEERRYNNARLDVLASSPSRVQ